MSRKGIPIEKPLKSMIILHGILLLYSFSGVLSKLAAQHDLLSFQFLLFYSIEIVLLGVYAIVWQQIIKKMPLILAYANKAVVIMWGLIWGILFFDEKIVFGKIFGACVVIVGVIMYSIEGQDG